MAAPDFWSNRERAQVDVEEVSRLRSLINPFQELEREIADLHIEIEALKRSAGIPGAGIDVPVAPPERLQLRPPMR